MPEINSIESQHAELCVNKGNPSFRKSSISANKSGHAELCADDENARLVESITDKEKTKSVHVKPKKNAMGPV